MKKIQFSVAIVLFALCAVILAHQFSVASVFVSTMFLVVMSLIGGLVWLSWDELREEERE